MIGIIGLAVLGAVALGGWIGGVIERHNEIPPVYASYEAVDCAVVECGKKPYEGEKP